MCCVNRSKHNCSPIRVTGVPVTTHSIRYKAHLYIHTSDVLVQHSNMMHSYNHLQEDSIVEKRDISNQNQIIEKEAWDIRHVYSCGMNG